MCPYPGPALWLFKVVHRPLQETLSIPFIQGYDSSFPIRLTHAQAQGIWVISPASLPLQCSVSMEIFWPKLPELWFQWENFRWGKHSHAGWHLAQLRAPIYPTRPAPGLPSAILRPRTAAGELWELPWEGTTGNACVWLGWKGGTMGDNQSAAITRSPQ